jgi:hypothetical protein
MPAKQKQTAKHPEQKQWKNRIVAQDDVAPGELQSNPSNWRIHTEFQRRVLRAVLAEVGWVKGVIVNKQTGLLLDGHLRVEEALHNGEESIPVTYVDLSVEEEQKVLAILDPLASLAIQDQALFAALTEELSFLSFDTGKLLADLKRIPSVEIDYEEEMSEDIALSNVTLKMGNYQARVNREVFLAWREQMYLQVGMNEADIKDEMKRRLCL